MAPARLHKVEDNKDSPLINKLTNSIGDWMLRHPTLTMLIFLIVLSILFAIVFNVLYNVFTIESGIERNFMVNNL